MGHNTRIRTSGSWTGTVQPGELQKLDDAQFAAIHEGGGAWSATAPIQLSGSGVDLQGANHKLSGTLTTSGTGSIHIGAGGSIVADANSDNKLILGLTDVRIARLQRRITSLPDAITTIDSTTRYSIFRAPTLTASRQVTLNFTDEQEADIVNDSATFALNLVTSGGATFSCADGSFSSIAVRRVISAGVWYSVRLVYSASTNTYVMLSGTKAA